MIGRVINNMSTVMETTAGHRDQIESLIGELGGLTHGLAGDRRAIDASIDSLQDLTSLTSGLLDETGNRSPATCAPSRSSAGSSPAAPPPSARPRAGIPKQLGVYIRSLGYGSYLNVYICNLFVKLPVAPSIPVDVGSRHSERCR